MTVLFHFWFSLFLCSCRSYLKLPVRLSPFIPTHLILSCGTLKHASSKQRSAPLAADSSANDSLTGM